MIADLPARLEEIRRGFREEQTALQSHWSDERSMRFFQQRIHPLNFALDEFARCLTDTTPTMNRLVKECP